MVYEQLCIYDVFPHATEKNRENAGYRLCWLRGLNPPASSKVKNA